MTEPKARAGSERKTHHAPLTTRSASGDEQEQACQTVQQEGGGLCLVRGAFRTEQRYERCMGRCDRKVVGPGVTNLKPARDLNAKLTTHHS